MNILDCIVSMALENVPEGDEIKRYFSKRGFQVVKKGTRGKHEADYLVIDARGQQFPVEEKKFRETRVSPSSWWAYWRENLADYSCQPDDRLSPQERGWIAVVDGQLREWCEIAGTETGYLSVEDATEHVGKLDRFSIRQHIDNALSFLSKEGKIRSWEADESGSYTFFEILYH